MPADIKTKFDKQPFEGPYEYVCLNKPKDADEDSDEDEYDSEDEPEDEEEAADQEPQAKRQKTKDSADDEKDESSDPKDIHGKPAADHPTWKWILMKESLDLLNENCRETVQRDPDNFNLHVYTDYWNYGVLDLVDNLCKAAQKPLKDNDLHKLWAVVAALGHFLNHRVHDNSWWGCDDGERCQEINHIIGRVILSTLDAVQRVGELHKESKFKDLGLVMALFAEYSLSTPDYGLETTWEETFDDGEFEDERQRDWHETIVAYAKKADIDLKNVGVSGTVIREGTDVEAFDGEDTDWGYADAVKTYWKRFHTDAPIMGGGHFNILKWSRAERKQYSFDNEDPLKDFPASVIKEGNLMPA